MKKIIMAMSGGVDSSAAAALLSEQGYEVHGVLMILADQADAFRAAEDAQAVAQRLGIELEVLDLRKLVRETVVEDFIQVYQRCETPNPCIVCNQRLKFGYLLDYAKQKGIEQIATGHYARIARDASGTHRLYKALDPRKDQSYVLYSLSPQILEQIRFPLGEMSKEQTRALAAAKGLLTAEKKDSQDICFVPDGDYAAFIERTLGHAFPEGEFVDASGKVLGKHKGLIHYTIGQRKGLGIASEAPLYVTRLDPRKNQVVLTHGEGLFTNVVYARSPHLMTEIPPEQPIAVSAKIRYAQREQRARMMWVERNGETYLRFDFEEPQRAVTPGQSVVAYQGDAVLGGGIICMPRE